MSSVEFGQSRVGETGVARQASRDDAIDVERVAEVAHHVIAKTDPAKLGHVKLNKILWYSDLEHYRWHGASLTGLRQYSRTAQGPMSPAITRAVRRLVNQGKVSERTVKVADFPRREMVALALPDIDAFTEQQAGILNQMIAIIAPLSANRLSQMTQSDPTWQEVGDGEAMSIATGSIISRPLRSR
jgi:uncharacterized phage-associated protein